MHTPLGDEAWMRRGSSRRLASAVRPEDPGGPEQEEGPAHGHRCRLGCAGRAGGSVGPQLCPPARHERAPSLQGPCRRLDLQTQLGPGRHWSSAHLAPQAPVCCVLPSRAPRPAVTHARQHPHDCPTCVRRLALQGARLPWGLPQDSPGCLGEQGARKGLHLHSTPGRKAGVAQLGPRTQPLLQPSWRERGPCARGESLQLGGRVEVLRGLKEHTARARPPDSASLSRPRAHGRLVSSTKVL